MARSTRTLIGFAVALALGAPPLAHAQAVPRNGGSSSAGSSGSGASSSGSSAPATPAPPPPPQAHVRTAPAGSRTAGTAHARPVTGSGSPATVVGRSPSGMPVYARSRDGRPVVGTAVPRSTVNTGRPSSVIVGPVSWWYPWYAPGFNWGLGYVGYDPWLYGSTSWIYGRYGLWYDPWGYNGYGYGYGYPYPSYAPYAGGEQQYAEAGELTGSLRLKVKPETAKVYVDGALMGTAGEFDGLFHHLELAAGAHELQFRADGYQTYTMDVTVAAGKTKTERISLRKK
jgi:PEGA domain